MPVSVQPQQSTPPATGILQVTAEQIIFRLRRGSTERRIAEAFGMPRTSVESVIVRHLRACYAVLTPQQIAEL